MTGIVVFPPLAPNAPSTIGPYNLTVGTVTTLASGASATVTMSGSYGQQSVNFGIPAGSSFAPQSAPANQFVTGVASNGTFTFAQPSATNLAGLGTGVLTALGNTAGAAGGFALFSSLASGAFAVAYTLPAATNAALGGVIIGAGINNSSGTISVTPYRGEIGGLTLSNDGTLPNTVLDISTGSATSDDFTTLMALGSAYTKSVSAWAVGTGNGGLDTGSVAASTWYHVYLIERTDTGVVDVLFSLSASAPTMPTSYTKKRRIGSFKTDASVHILPFSQNGDEFLWVTPVQDVNVATLSTTATAYALSVPLGVKVNALFSAQMSNTAVGVAVAVFSPDQTGTAASYQLVNEVASQYAGGQFNVRTNTSQQVKAVSASASTTFVVMTQGYIDTRGRFA